MECIMEDIQKQMYNYYFILQFGKADRALPILQMVLLYIYIRLYLNIFSRIKRISKEYYLKINLNL